MLAERPASVWPRGDLLALALGATASVLGATAIAVYEPALGLGVLAGASVLAIVVARPVRAAFFYLALTPLVAGVPRGQPVPQLRLSEALLALLLVGVLVRLLTDALGGGPVASIRDYRVTELDRTMLAMAVFGSFVPLAWRAARGYRPLLDDLLYATTLWKYLLVYLLFRLVVTDEYQVRACVKIMLGVGAVVGAIAIAQAVNTPGVPGLLASMQEDPSRAVANYRGSSTLGTSHGVADVMAFDLSLSLAFWYFRVGPRWLSAAGISFFGIACLASGQISAALALLVVAVAFGWWTRRLWRSLGVAVPAGLVAGVLLWPVVQARLTATDSSGLPDSWAARRFNLTNYFWPELLGGGNWILGVRPAGRLPSFEPWRDWVYIESGHTWLLWTGGVPLLLAFLWFSRRAFVASLSLAGGRPTTANPEPAGSGRFASAVGLGAMLTYAVVFALMVLDVHLTMRGPADALFPLLALLTVRALWSDDETYQHAVVGRPLVRRWARR